MRKKLESYIKKYSTLEDFKALGSQAEKDDYLLIERAIIVSYDDHFLQIQHNLDNLINSFINRLHDKEYYLIKGEDPLFSIYSNVNFEGKTNLYNPSEYMSSFSIEASFSSLYQYIIFHKAILFLDRDSASKILKANSKNELTLLEANIKNIDKGVWCKYRVEIGETGIREILKSNEIFKSELYTKAYKLLVFIDEIPFWSVKSKSNETASLTQDNYLGKLLTKICLELQ